VGERERQFRHHSGTKAHAAPTHAALPPATPEPSSLLFRHHLQLLSTLAFGRRGEASEENFGGMRSNRLPDSAVGRSVFKKSNGITDTRDFIGIFLIAPSGVVDILNAFDIRD